MKWYAETGPLRSRQLLTDALVLLWAVLWVRVGLAVEDAVRTLGAPGRELEAAGDGLAGGLAGAAERADDVPVVGGGLAAPLEVAAGAGGALARGEPGAAEALAALELRAQGLRG
jgi:hypothetical protein